MSSAHARKGDRREGEGNVRDIRTHDGCAPRRRGQAATATVKGSAESQPRGVNTCARHRGVRLIPVGHARGIDGTSP